MEINLNGRAGVDLIEFSCEIAHIDAKKINQRYNYKEVGHLNHDNFNFGRNDERIFDERVNNHFVKQMKIQISTYQIFRAYKKSGKVYAQIILKVKPIIVELGNITNYSWNQVLYSLHDTIDVLHNEWGITINNNIYIANVELNKTFILTKPVDQLIKVWDEYIKFYSKLGEKGNNETGCGAYIKKTNLTYENQNLKMKIYDKIRETDKNCKDYKVLSEANLVRLEFKIKSKGLKSLNLNKNVYDMNDEVIEAAFQILVQKHVLLPIRTREKEARKTLENIFEYGKINSRENRNELLIQMLNPTIEHPRILMHLEEIDEDVIRLNKAMSKSVGRVKKSLLKLLENHAGISTLKRSETKDVLDEFVAKAVNVCEETIHIWTEPKR